jgi:NADPH-dependent glutamate synthase beta subunit-like oxidoreductase
MLESRAMSNARGHAVAVIGGATAGAEAAGIFAGAGIRTVVFEQNARPYGKVEDGLPRWHVALRRKEYDTIDEKLTQSAVHYVPETRIGRDLALGELASEWGFHAVVLANGAWRDRPLPIEGADRYVDRGLVYQNPFIYWFNHYNERSYQGPQYEIQDGTIVVGGGLASIDVVKVINLELVLRALAARGIEQDLVEMEVGGIPKALERHGLSLEALGLRGGTLYYRRRPEDMPLVEMPDDVNEKAMERIRKARVRVLEKAMEKYLFQVAPLHAPVGLITEGDRLAGLVFARTEMRDGKLVTTDQRVEVRAPLVISSIGSIPEPVRGIPMQGELYEFTDPELGTLREYPTLFSVGNVVTGKGNIVASRKHARRVGLRVLEQHFALADQVKRLPPLTPAQEEALQRRVEARQRKVGYDGDYAGWIQAHTPPDRV